MIFIFSICCIDTSQIRRTDIIFKSDFCNEHCDNNHKKHCDNIYDECGTDIECNCFKIPIDLVRLYDDKLFPKGKKIEYMSFCDLLDDYEIPVKYMDITHYDDDYNENVYIRIKEYEIGDFVCEKCIEYEESDIKKTFVYNLFDQVAHIAILLFFVMNLFYLFRVFFC